MQSDGLPPESASRSSSSISPILRYLSIVLMAYGAVGVATSLRLLPLVWGGLSSWSGLHVAWDVPDAFGLLAPLQAHYDARPWLPWAAWLVGLAILAVDRRMVSTSSPAAQPERRGRVPWVGLAVLLVLLVAGGYARMSELWPQDYGLVQMPYDDEGVYAGASQLFLQGIVPYRDYFFAHPPVAAISYAPAMAYHFTEWGSPTSFMMARYLSVAYSLVTLALIFLIGWRLAGLWSGTLAAGLWAFDGRVVEINRKVMLDGPMVLLSCAGLLLYLWARPAMMGSRERAPKRPLLVLFFAGVCAALSALTKIAGVACLIALTADLLWLWFDNRRSPERPSIGLPGQLLALLGGALVAGLVVLTPFLVMVPSQMVRMVFFFQLLRASDGLIDVPSRIADLTSSYGNALTILFASLGFILLTVVLWMRKTAGPWRAIVLWTFFSVLLFTYSRSFYGHYYIQLAAPLCLLGGAVSLLPYAAGSIALRLKSRATVTRSAVSPEPVSAGGLRMRSPRLQSQGVTSLVAGALIAVVALPLLLVQWNGENTRQCPHCDDPLFRTVARYVNDAVPPGTPVLTTDEQFNLLAARPPSRNATGYLVDSYGHMIFLGVGINTSDWGELISAVLHGEHSNDVYAVMHSPASQADFLDRASRASLIVIHDTGRARLTTSTLSQIAAEAKIAAEASRYTIYRKPVAGK